MPGNHVLYQPMDRNTMDTAASFANGAAGSITAAQLWVATLRRSTANEDWWSRFRKAGRSSPIVFEKRPGSAGGARVNIRTQGTLGGIGKMGDNRFAVAADFGSIPHGELAVYLDLIKQATGVTPHAQEMLALGTQVQEGIPDQLGKWGGRYLTRHTDMTLLHTCAATSRMVVNNKTIATLLTTDGVGWNAIMNASNVMSDRGGTPFKMGKQANGEDLWNFMFPLPKNLASAVKADSRYRENLVGNAVRGSDSPFFSGVIEAIDGNTIASRQIHVHNGQVPAGSPWAPIAYLGVAHDGATDTAGTDVTLQGGGNMYVSGVTTTPWFTDFPGYAHASTASLAFPWREDSFLTAANSFWGTGPFYALVVNPPTAATDPGKIGMIAYTVGAGANVLTMTGRLSASGTTLINDTTVGGVVYGGAVINSANFTSVFAKGAAIIPCNRLGTPIGAFCGIGADAVGFVRGNFWGDLFKQKVEGGLSGEQVFTGWTFGQSLYTTPNLDTPGVVVCACAVPYPQYNLPATS